MPNSYQCVNYFHFKVLFSKVQIICSEHVKFVVKVRMVSELSLKVARRRKRQNLNIYSCSAPTSTALLSSIKTDEFFMGTIFCNLTLNIVSQKEFSLNVFKTLH